MSDRQEFENKFPLQKGVMWNDVSKAYTVSASYEDWAESNVHAHQANMMWQAYEAAHKAQQAEIARLTSVIKKCNKLAGFKNSCDNTMDESLCEIWTVTDKALEGNQ